LDESSRGLITDPFWSFADPGPVFLTNVIVDLDGQIANIKAILPVPPWAGNPIFVARFDVEVVGLETTLESLKGPAPVVKRGEGSRRGDASDASGTYQAFGLRLDIHDSGVSLSLRLFEVGARLLHWRRGFGFRTAWLYSGDISS
jgi:hypothetical protein